MRGRRDPQTTMLALVDLEERVPRNHPLRLIKPFADRALRELLPVFDDMYATAGRPSIPPERLLKAWLLISLYSVRSECAICEELDYQLLYRWFLDIGLLEPSFDPTVFRKNQRRLLRHDVAQLPKPFPLQATGKPHADAFPLSPNTSITSVRRLRRACRSSPRQRYLYGTCYWSDEKDGSCVPDHACQRQRGLQLRIWF